MDRSWKLQPALTETLRTKWHWAFVLRMTPTQLMLRKEQRVLPRGIPFGALANLARAATRDLKPLFFRICKTSGDEEVADDRE